MAERSGLAITRSHRHQPVAYSQYPYHGAALTGTAGTGIFNPDNRPVRESRQSCPGPEKRPRIRAVPVMRGLGIFKRPVAVFIQAAAAAAGSWNRFPG
jgi:hypothetical protein